MVVPTAKPTVCGWDNLSVRSASLDGRAGDVSWSNNVWGLPRLLAMNGGFLTGTLNNSNIVRDQLVLILLRRFVFELSEWMRSCARPYRFEFYVCKYVFHCLLSIYLYIYNVLILLLILYFRDIWNVWDDWARIWWSVACNVVYPLPALQRSGRWRGHAEGVRVGRQDPEFIAVHRELRDPAELSRRGPAAGRLGTSCGSRLLQYPFIHSFTATECWLETFRRTSMLQWPYIAKLLETFLCCFAPEMLCSYQRWVIPHTYIHTYSLCPYEVWSFPCLLQQRRTVRK